MRIKLPIVILIVLLAVYFFGDVVSTEMVAAFFTVSNLIKELLVFFLPLIIFTFMASFLSEMEHRAWSFIAIVGASIAISNTLVTYVSYGVYYGLHPLVVDACSSVSVLKGEELIFPLFQLPVQPLISNNIALLSGLFVGIVLSFISVNNPVSKAVVRFRAVCISSLRKVLLPLIPLFIFGFLLKLQRESNFENLLAMYTKVFVVTLLIMWAYVFCLYLVAARGRVQLAWHIFKEFIPPSMAAFASMSSMAAYPITLNTVERTSPHPKLTQGILTSTVNTHLMGVGIAIPILAITVAMYFGRPFPGVWEFSIFAIYFTLAKFSVAAIPGGSILMAVPVLQDHLEFTPEMSALIISIYMLVDPFSTATNVLGNGAFSNFMTRLLSRIYALKNN